jgi:hypothetical protein
MDVTLLTGAGGWPGPPAPAATSRYYAQRPELAGAQVRHLRRILTECAQHYNDRRPHQPREQRAPLHEPREAIDLTTRIKRRQTAQGLINEHVRAA